MQSFFIRAAVAAGFVAATLTGAHAIDIEEVTSPGGITAWLVSDETVPIVSVDVAFEGGGGAQDPDGKAGRANLMAALLDEGAGDLNSAAFQTALRDSAVRMNFSAGRDHLFGSMRALSASVERGFDLLNSALTEPRFDTPAMERVQAQVLANLRQESQNPNAVAARLWARTAFPDHPYGTPVDGTLETVPTLMRSDLTTVHEAVIARDNLVVAVVGDISAERLAPLLDRAFGNLPESADLTPVPDTTPVTGVTAREPRETPQTAIRFGLPGIARDDPDYLAAVVMNHILGGGSFSSWLFQEVREKRGLAYGVYSFLAPREHTAILGGGTATRNDQADEALAVIVEQIQRMADDGPTDDELDAAKAYLTGSYALRFGSSNSIARQLLGIQIEDLGMDYVDRRNALVESVTLEDVRRVTARILGQGAPTVAIVAPAAG